MTELVCGDGTLHCEFLLRSLFRVKISFGNRNRSIIRLLPLQHFSNYLAKVKLLKSLERRWVVYSWRKFQTYAFRSTFFFNRVCETVVYKFISLRKNGSPKQRLKIILHRNNRNNRAGINLIKTRDVLLRIERKKEKKKLWRKLKKKNCSSKCWKVTPLLPSSHLLEFLSNAVKVPQSQ